MLRRVPLVPIARADDPRVSGYAGIRDRDLRADHDQFIVEGEVVVRMLLSPASRFRVRSLFLEERRAEKLEDALARLPDDVPVYVAPQPLMDGLVGFPIHRGVLALADRRVETVADALPVDGGENALAVGLLGVVNHDNVGGIFRSAAAFGARAVLLDPVTCDPLYRKAVRVSVGGSLVVPFARAASEDALLDAFAERGFELLALSADGASDIDELAGARRVALLIGAEGPGLSPSVLRRAKGVRIPMQRTLDSLNASVACGIALFSVARALGKAGR